MQAVLTLTSELSIWIRCIDETFPAELLTVWSSFRVDDHVAHDEDDNTTELERGRERKISLAHGKRAISLKQEPSGWDGQKSRKCYKYISFNEENSAVVLWWETYHKISVEILLRIYLIYGTKFDFNRVSD